MPAEASAPTSRWPRLHARPARTRCRRPRRRGRRAGSVRARAARARAALPTPVGVLGPPSAGMHPANGMKLDGTPAGPTDVASKTVERLVVIPGLTGLPIRPGKLHLDPGVRDAGVEAADEAVRAFQLPDRSADTRAGRARPGTITHGPAIGLQIVRPSQTRGGLWAPRPEPRAGPGTRRARAGASREPPQPDRRERRRRRAGTRSRRCRRRTRARTACGSCRCATSALL